jgi:hypothetical protein
MAAKLKWRNNVLTVGGAALYVGISDAEDGHWEAFGDMSYGTLLEQRWENDADARQDCEAEVRRLLREAGVEVEP